MYFDPLGAPYLLSASQSVTYVTYGRSILTLASFIIVGRRICFAKSDSRYSSGLTLNVLASLCYTSTVWTKMTDLTDSLAKEGW